MRFHNADEQIQSAKWSWSEAGHFSDFTDMYKWQRGVKIT